MNITYGRAITDKELNQILTLQQKNAPTNLSAEEKVKEGFITVIHSFEQLKKFNEDCPHIIAKYQNEVIGYALCMTKKFREEIPVLTPMFNTADSLLKGKNYLALGQICVSKQFRGKGVFRGMYTFYRKELNGYYDCLVTEVATSNKRSLNAHLNIGFDILETQISEGISWELICWDWK
ncbi:GNAT family N-acetyltransferase [Maribacter sp. CXY002]|uniref:GNAT family N-acetyltransferase n=1 Tax=Maribacter luteocoastalis TaxID=3407671 RepID=UPI003B674D41